MSQRVKVEITLSVKGPFLFQGMVGSLMGRDATQLRDEHGGPVIPADQVKGVLREALLDIADDAPGVITPQEVDALFGEESPENTGDSAFDEPRRARAFFSDLTGSPTKKALADGVAGSPPPTTTRVEIDDATGAAKTGHLQVVELVVRFGEPVAFSGVIVAYCPDGQAERLAAAIDKAVKVVGAIGAFKSAGFGAVDGSASGATLRDARTLALPSPKSLAAERFGFAVTFDRPILVDAGRIANNAFAGSAIVPGAALKGALARKLELAGGEALLARFEAALAGLVIGHAFPEDSAGAPGGEPFPLSTIACEDEDSDRVTFADALDVNRKDLNGDAPPCAIGGRLATFRVDWKERVFPAAARHFGRPQFEEPAMLARTHTAISELGTAATGQLFTTIMRSNLSSADIRQERRFLLAVDLASVPDGEKDNARILVALLAEGLDGIGKTSATATFKPCDDGATPPTPYPVHGHDDLFAVVLRTDGLMTDPRTKATAAEAYADYWRRTVPGPTLVDFCAAQRLAGGYLATRRRPWRATYHPFVLTEAGSTFLLRGKIREPLTRLLRHGLPPPPFEGVAR